LSLGARQEKQKRRRKTKKTSGREPMVSIHLSHEEKLFVLLGALALFLLALLVSLCLALPFCALNRWLVGREARRKRRLDERHFLAACSQGMLAYNQHQLQQRALGPFGLVGGPCGLKIGSGPELLGGGSGRNSLGPPPAYEAALRASRLHSLASGCSLSECGAQTQKTSATSGASEVPKPPEQERPLELGDYFHAPKESLRDSQQSQLGPVLTAGVLPGGKTAEGRQEVGERPPVRLRLWVKVLEPGELVERARLLAASSAAEQHEWGASSERRHLRCGVGANCSGTSSPSGLGGDSLKRRLSRQLSLPQLLGSLKSSLASAHELGQSAETLEQADRKQEVLSAASCTDVATSGAASGEQQAFSSLGSSSSGSTASCCEGQCGELAAGGCQLSSGAPLALNIDRRPHEAEGEQPTEAEVGAGKSAGKLSCGSQGTQKAALESGQLGDEKQGVSTADCCSSGQWAARRRVRARPRAGAKLLALVSGGSAVSSRVLHMNVASFSFSKEETFISTKRHSQLNWRHFGAGLAGRLGPSSGQPANGQAASGQPVSGQQQQQHVASSSLKQQQESKACQLLVTICDLENVLASGLAGERPLLQLAACSSLTVQCEILAPASSGGPAAAAKQVARSLLAMRNPLRPDRQSAAARPAHQPDHQLVELAQTLPASAMGQPPAQVGASISHWPPFAGRLDGPQTVSGEASGLQSESSSASSGGEAAAEQAAETQLGAALRHEPRANGKPIVAFQTVPKQLAPQLVCNTAGQLSRRHCSSAGSGAPAAGASVDLVQFDAVFVSPVLSKSLIESGAHLRVRVYAQCPKYLNDSCLVELKLPLKPLLRSSQRDNLALADQSSQCLAGSEFILSNLLANMVTGATGLPLGALLSQIDAEQEAHELTIDEADLEEQEAQQREQIARQDSVKQAPNESLFNRWWPGGGASLRGQKASVWTLQEERELELASAEPPQLSLADEHSFGLQDEHQEHPDDPQQWQLVEQNYFRSLMVSHWLNYLAAPSYECQPVEEPRGTLLLGLTFLPTSNRLVFNPLSASLDPNAGQGLAPPAGAQLISGHSGGPRSLASGGKQLMKELRLQADVCYLLRFLMVAEGRVLRRKQTKASRRPEWAMDGAQGEASLTFDLVSVGVHQPAFVVALVLRSSLESCTTDNQHRASREPTGSSTTGPAHCQPPEMGPQSRGPPPHSHYGPGGAQRSAICRPSADSQGGHRRQQMELDERRRPNKKRDLVVGHVLLGQEMWRQLRAQPRKQLVKQFKLL